MKKFLCILMLLLLQNTTIVFSQIKSLPDLPNSFSNLVLKAPITSWDEAIPLGNGLLGGLFWGEKNTIRLSLDRGDLWDERTYGEKEWWKNRTYTKGVALLAAKLYDSLDGWWNEPYNGITPTKIPAGRIEIKLPATEAVNRFDLNLATAEGTAYFNSDASIKTFFSAIEKVAIISIRNCLPDSINLLSTLDVYNNNQKVKTFNSNGGTILKLGYPIAEQGFSNDAKWYIQEAAEGLKYCVYVKIKKTQSETLIALTITSSKDAKSFVTLASKRCSTALNQGYTKVLSAHSAWWKKFWQQSSVSIPDTAIQRHYNLVQYFYGSASRIDAPPMPLQGVWTADNGSLPPWKGDYHNDLNTQMTYMAYQESGRFNEGASYINYLWDRKKIFEDFAKDFYGTKGLACPGVMSYAGQPLGGWGQYSMSPTMSAWSAHLFYLHWLYTADEKFLQEKAYPWCAEVGECMLGLLKPDKNGRLVLPISTSPEIFDNSSKAWLEPNSNYDIMCLKMLFLSLQEMASANHKNKEAFKWKNAANGLGDFHTKSDGKLLLDAKTEMPYSHRHLSNLIGIYPFNLITSAGGKKDSTTIQSSLKNWDSLGTKAWTGYSFTWMSCLRARVGDAEEALRNLEIFVQAFILRNGFHANGDQTKLGYSKSRNRDFTLEGNFLAAQAVQEMLLQSWSSKPGKLNTGIIRIFPAVSNKWKDVSFKDLRAEGGYKVSAVRKNYYTVSFSVQAAKTGLVHIQNNFKTEPYWNIKGVRKIGDVFEVLLIKGQTLRASL
ncbi:MAG: glycoside hydrolase N-terminal domain-containing protein [Chitinophagaceae bacterium]|nr:glycoside hydrolase N-terminal domain-containing protein [Chitinophagaceae bacterium]